MSCHGCAESFGFLKKEYGCPKCGFSYCKKCLRFKIMDEKSGKALAVCHGCCAKSVDSSNALGQNKRAEKSADIMEAFHKLQSLENPDRPPITLYREGHNTRLGRLKKGMSVEDQKILERLEGLRHRETDGSHRRTSDNPEEEVAARLAKLRGEEYPSTSSSNKLPNKPPETDADLIARLTSEVALDQRHQTSIVADIEERLSKLRQGQPDANAAPTETQASGGTHQDIMEVEELSEAEQVRRIIEKFKGEVELESKLNTTTEEDHPIFSQEESNVESTDAMESDDDVDVDHLCRICDEKRATVMCKECDDDIFCKACFIEFHKEIDEMHKPKNI